MPTERPRLALLTNVLSPYRVPVYERIAEVFDLTVVLSGREDNRPDWDKHKDESYPFHIVRLKGRQFRYRQFQNGRFMDTGRVHINPGIVACLAKLRPDAVVSIEMGFRSLSALLYGRLWRRPVWIWWGGTLHTESNISRSRAILRKIFAKLAKRWISYGKTSTEYLESVGIPSNRILTIQNCVDERPFVASVPPSLDIQPKPVLLCVGRLVPLKGLEELVQAAGAVAKEGLEFTLVMAGEGPERKRLEEAAAASGLNMRFIGAQLPEDMPGVYRSADALVFPTLRDVWGLVVNEALLCGLPVLGSVYAGCSEELLPPESICDPLDAESLKQGVLRAIHGQLPKPELTRIWTHQEVADAICNDVQNVLSTR